MLLVQGPDDRRLVALHIVVCKPKAGDTAPEGAGELGKRVEEVIVHDLVYDLEQHKRQAEQGEVRQAEQRHGQARSNSADVFEKPAWGPRVCRFSELVLPETEAAYDAHRQ